MKIFSSFNTNLKKIKLKEHQDEFGMDNVMIVSKSGLFLFVKVFPRIIGSFIILIITVLVCNWIFGSSQDKYTVYVLIGVIVVLLTLAGPIIKHLIDYYMDFVLITPKSLIMFNQTGIFKKDTVTVDASKIKTISVIKRHFLYSIFDNGDIIFLSEGDNEKYGEIKLYFIFRPGDKKDRISKIIGYNI